LTVIRTEIIKYTVGLFLQEADVGICSKTLKFSSVDGIRSIAQVENALAEKF